MIPRETHHTQIQYKQQLENGLGGARYQIPAISCYATILWREKIESSLKDQAVAILWDVLLVHSKGEKKACQIHKKRKEEGVKFSY